MIWGLEAGFIIPLVVYDDERKYVAMTALIFDRDGLKFSVIPATIMEDAVKKYEELKKKGYKPVDLELGDIIDVYNKAKSIIPPHIYTAIIAVFYGDEVIEKILKKLERDEETRKLFEAINSLIKRKDREKRENTLVR